MFATSLAVIMILVFAAANVIRQKKKGKLFEPAAKNRFICCVFVFVAGAVSANGLFHFAHGVLGYSDFPAPFAVLANSARFTNTANIIWGLLNFAVAAFVTASYRKSVPAWLFAVCFAAGFIFIALMLRFVLLAGYYEAHLF